MLHLCSLHFLTSLLVVHTQQQQIAGAFYFPTTKCQDKMVKNRADWRWSGEILNRGCAPYAAKRKNIATYWSVKKRIFQWNYEHSNAEINIRRIPGRKNKEHWQEIFRYMIKYWVLRVRENFIMLQGGPLIIRPYPWYLLLAMVNQFWKRLRTTTKTTTLILWLEISCSSNTKNEKVKWGENSHAMENAQSGDQQPLNTSSTFQGIPVKHDEVY